MEKRKNPEKELKNKSGLFFQIGLLITMMICVSAFEYRVKSVVQTPIELPPGVIDNPIVQITIQDPPPPPPKPKFITPIEVKNEDPIDEIPPETVLDNDQISSVELPEPEPMPEEPAAPEYFTIVESMPEPNGGYEGFYKFVQKNLKYPAAARRMGIEGKVYVQFIINEKGEITNIEILKGIGAGCDEEVLRVMKKAPNWTPGKQRGEPVKVKRVLPIDFTMG